MPIKIKPDQKELWIKAKGNDGTTAHSLTQKRVAGGRWRTVLEKIVVDTSGILNVAMQSHPSAGSPSLPSLRRMVRACERRAVVV